MQILGTKMATCACRFFQYSDKMTPSYHVIIWFLKKWKYNVNVSGFTNIFEWRHEVVKQFRKEHWLNWIFILLYHISYLLSPLCRLSNFKWKYGGYLQSCLSSSMISQNCWWYHHSVDKICQDLQRKGKALNTHNYLVVWNIFERAKSDFLSLNLLVCL
jgi:hypothetical protein